MALKGQITPKESVTGTIHRLGYNEIQELKEQMVGTIAAAEKATADANEAADVIFTDFNSITQESDVFSFKEEGVYYNNVGERTEHSKYTSYHLLAESDFVFYFDGVWELLEQAEISTGSLYANVFSNGVASRENARVTEHFSTEGRSTEFPWKMGMAIKVYKGELFIISLPDDFHYHNGVEFVKGFNCRTTYGEAGMVLADGVQFGKDQVAEVKSITKATSLQIFSEQEESLFDPPNMYPDCFELWKDNSAINDITSIGSPIMSTDDDTYKTYRIDITPGRTYAFTPCALAGYIQLAVCDANDIVLDLANYPVDVYTVQMHYNGVVPSRIYFAIHNSIDEGDIVFKDGRLGKLERDVSEAKTKAETAAAGAIQAYNRANAAFAGVNEVKTMASGAANALKGYASGAIIGLSDMSPIEHNVGAKVKSKNLLHLVEGTSVSNGITFTRNAEGTVSAKGTATGFASAKLGDVTLKGGRYYTISGSQGGNRNQYQLYTTGGITFYEGSSRTKYVEADTVVSVAAVVYQGSAVDGVIFKPQIEEGETATDFTPFVDVQNTVLKVCGKNFFDPTIYTHNGYGVVQDDGSILIESPNYNQICVYDPKGDNRPVTVSYYYKTAKDTGSIGQRFYAMYADSTIGSYPVTANSKDKYTYASWTTPSNRTLVGIYTDSGQAGNTTCLKDIQFEFSSEATPYEPFVGAEYTPNADGTVDGVKSIAPMMILQTDADGATIDAEYNRDMNKAFAALENAIKALGGTVV